jgi:cytochrome P450
MTVTTNPVEFDPFSEEFFNDPYELYRRLRDEAPVYYSERYGFYALSRFADVLAAHRDWQAFSSAHGIELFLLSKDPEEIRSYRSIIMMDPPEHDTFRALVSRVFTPRAVNALEPMIREVICSFLDPLDDAREFDAVADFAAPFPVEVISRMLGVPDGERQQIRHWLDISLHREPGQTDPSPENEQAMLEQGVYFHELTVEKRKNPGDDMLSRLTQVTVDRGDGAETGLDDAEIAGFASLLGGAGAETVTKLVGNAVMLFWQHPDQWQKVGDDREKIPRAIEEILRYWPPSQYQGRYCEEEREFDGGTIPAGFPVLLITGAATRDPGPSSAPTSSTSNGNRASPSGSAMVRTAASGQRWHVWRAGSRSQSSRRGGSGWKSTKRDCVGCRWPTSPATRTCPSALFAERQRWEGATLTIGSRWSRRARPHPS